MVFPIDRITPPEAMKVVIDQIVNKTAEYFHIRLVDHLYTEDICKRARQVALVLSYELTPATVPEIAGYFGRSEVAYRKAKEALDLDRFSLQAGEETPDENLYRIKQTIRVALGYDDSFQKPARIPAPQPAEKTPPAPRRESEPAKATPPPKARTAHPPSPNKPTRPLEPRRAKFVKPSLQEIGNISAILVVRPDIAILIEDKTGVALSVQRQISIYLAFLFGYSAAAIAKHHDITVDEGLKIQAGISRAVARDSGVGRIVTDCMGSLKQVKDPTHATAVLV